MNLRSLGLALLMVCLAVISCNRVPKETPLTIHADTEKEDEIAKTIMESLAIELAPGLTIDLWASDSLAPDPVALSVDNQGRIYLTRTNRQKNSEFDIRGFRHWMTPSIALQSVEDRRAFLHSTFAPEKSKENEWLPDLNGDGSHDWRDLAVEKEEVWRLTDTDGNGRADISERILEDFHEEITDVAGGLLIRDEDVFVGVGPDLWRLWDTNGDGVLDKKVSISHGYAVHIGFSGHGMSGIIEGPDGKIYWGIGDIGANITTSDGRQFKYPNQGIIVRSNPDGSDFEVFAAGLRNTHEFVFDEYGNVISSDNDGDHPGESERLVHIIEGHDAGWRANWQYGKYTDPKNNTYKVWMDEELYKPRWEGQAAYIIPPIVNYHNGPTGMAYNPGTALGSEWKNTFFLVEFVGNPSRSHIWSFRLEPEGASFRLKDEKDVISGILPTGIRFGPDGALYVADWVNGWGTKNYGRVWKIDVAPDKNDLAKQRAETQRLMALDYKSQSIDALYDLLFYDDMRIRQKAQFELATRGRQGREAFLKAIQQTDNQLARIHGIWGMGQLMRGNEDYGNDLLGLLDDSDPEIIAQAAKVLGDERFEKAGDALIPLLQHENPRVKFFAAQGLGRIAYAPAIEPLLRMIDENRDRDVYLRHAGVLALSRIGFVQPIAELVDHPSRSLRIAAVLVLRRLSSDQVALFLKDEDEYIVTEAARAINDDWSIEAALPALAETLNDPRFTSEPLLRRAINACLRVGGTKELETLVAYAQREDAPAEMRAEALATLATWPDPSVTDRVDGRYRGEIKRDPAEVIAKVSEPAGALLKSKEEEVAIATAKMISELGIQGYESELLALLQRHASAPMRVAALQALHKLKYQGLEDAVRRAMEDRDGSVRTAALGLLNDVDMSVQNLEAVARAVFRQGTLREQQELLRVLGAMDVSKSGAVLEPLVERAVNKQLSPGVTLDLLEAVDSTGSQQLITRAAPLRSTATTGVAAFSETLFGGDARRGRMIFLRHETAQCARCHTVGAPGAEVGPPLMGIGEKLTREQLLEALIEPSARIAPGYGMVTLTLTDGHTVSGTLMEERADQLILKTSDAEPLVVAKSRISKRENLPSSMPPMGTLLSRREIRDVIEFLSSMRSRDDD
ncbi:MAG: HEAT repeat domain-containing protein [Cyclobacteriaceae bacterium]|nr:HEAT repeat domain-containing protein [Cyclobacteriaceae bacterium]